MILEKRLDVGFERSVIAVATGTPGKGRAGIFAFAIAFERLASGIKNINQVGWRWASAGLWIVCYYLLSLGDARHERGSVIIT